MDASNGGAGERRDRRALRSLALPVIAGLLGSGLALGARELGEPEPATRAVRGAVNAERATLAPTGMLVTLRRPGGTEAPTLLDHASPFWVSVDALEPVAAVELWAGDSLVDRVVPDDRRTGRTEVLAWAPEIAGTTTLVARAYDAQARVGQSNPVRVVVADAPGVDAELAGPVEADAPADPSGVDGQSTRAATTARLLPELPAGLGAMAPPTLAVEVADCVLDAQVKAAAPTDNLTLLEVAPSGQSFQPLLDLGGAGPGDPAAASAPLAAGLHTLVVAAADDGSTAAWSALVDLAVPDECDGWQGDVKLANGRLLTGDGEVPDVDQAYLYLLTDEALVTAAEPGDAAADWVRVPPVGFVTKGSTGLDFTAFLPSLGGHDLAIEAWGRTGPGSVEAIGTGRLRLDPLIPLDPVVGAPAVQLHWVKADAFNEELLTEATMNTPKELTFRWSTELAGVTHILWQVTPAKVPKSAGVFAPTVVAQGVVPAEQDTFEIDFTPFPHDLYPDPATAPDYLDQGGSTAASLDGAATYEMMTGGLGLGGEKEPLEIGPLLGLYYAPYEEGQYVVRALPFAGDTYVGPPSNDVVLHSTGFEEAPPGEPSYDLDVELIDEPRPPDPYKSACWQIVGYVDGPGYQAGLAADQKAMEGLPLVYIGQYPYAFWDFMWTHLGDNPVCAGCYHVGGLKVGLAGGECSSSSFLGSLFSAFETLVNLIADGFAELKSMVVDAVATISGCNAVASASGGGKTGESICNTLAEVAVNAALMSLGIPPTVPNFDELVAAAEFEIVELGASLAAQAGVPCDDASFAAEIHGEDELTCEGAVGALLDTVTAEINKAYVGVASSMGFSFPKELRVVPHPDGQVKPAEIEVTVTPNEFSQAAGGATCTALVANSVNWTAKGDFIGTLMAAPLPPGATVVKNLLPGLVPGATAYYQIPQTTWGGPVFLPPPLQLPDLKPGANGGALAPATRTYQLYPPASAVAVPVLTVAEHLNGDAFKSSLPLPHHVLLLQAGARFKMTMLSSCAGSSSKTYALHGFASPDATPVEVPG